MKTLTLLPGLALLLLSLSSSAKSPAPAQTTDDKNTSLFTRVNHRYQAVLQGVSFYYYTQADRVQIISEFLHSIESDYALLDIKAKRFNIDMDELKKQALADETAIRDTADEKEQASSNLQFLDRAKKLVALFQDTHFSAKARAPLNPTLLPFAIAKSEGKYIILGRYRKLMEYLAQKDPSFSEIELGQEVVSIDDLPIEKAIAALTPFISGSSQAFRESRAATALTFRDFAFPDRGYAIVGLKNKNGDVVKMKFPWFYRMPSRGDENLYFKERGFLQYDQLRMNWDEENNKWASKSIPLDNEDSIHSLPALTDKHEFNNQADDTIVKTGYVLRGGKAYAVLQINSFMESDVFDEKKNKISFLQALRAFINKIDSESTPLILDLRGNGGGNGKYPAALLSMLTEDKTYGGPTQALRVTRNSQELTDESTDHETVPEELKALSQEQLNKLLTDAIQDRDVHTAAFSTGDIQADPEVGGFSQKVVALLTPECISACDMTAFLLKSSGRATIIGSPSNGTGAGFLSSGALDSQFTDSYRVLQANIPNFLFGLPGAPGTLLFPGQAEALNSENKPTQPDVLYEGTTDDLLHGSQGWINKAIEILNK
ncbi:MAG: S41 family peptidase [Bdellovibrionota bacterium]